VWLTYGVFYKFVVKTSAAVTIGTYDNIYGIVGVQASVGTTIPTGVISLWYGAIGSVPTGWYLCDGSNGTPDLRDKFVVGAGSTYSVNATGGSANSVVVNHTHTATVTDPGHNHNFNYAAYSWGITGGASVINANRFEGGTGTTTTATTGISVANSTSGVSGTNANLPPYYALAYIMKA
jgi:hypothetical protein